LELYLLIQKSSSISISSDLRLILLNTSSKIIPSA
jgi:hypothetical protein